MNDKQGPSSWVTYYKICVADTWLCQVDKCQREMEKEKERNHVSPAQIDVCTDEHPPSREIGNSMAAFSLPSALVDELRH